MTHSASRRTAPRRRAASLLAALPLLAGVVGAENTATAGPHPVEPAPATAAAPDPACGDHLLADGEDCESCAGDCAPAACSPAGRHTALVTLAPQAGYETAGAVTILLTYRTDRLTLPGRGGPPELTARRSAIPTGAQMFANHLGHALRVVVSAADGLPPGPLVEVTLDGCAGAPAPSSADLACRVEQCAAGGVPLTECTCSVTLR